MNVVGEDRISKLPDPYYFIIYSLFFLPSVSKRWKDVWVYVPTLDFQNWEPPGILYASYEDYDEEAIVLETKKFMDFVDRILVQRNMLNINKFSLDCGFFDHKRVNAWITTAIKCGVEEFIFSGCFSYPSNGKMIPDSLFTCETLTTLDFQIEEQNRLDLPGSISLPRLKILRLTNFMYYDEKLAAKLFSSCPVLEELRLTDCGLLNFDFICVSAPILKSFTLISCLRSNMEGVKPVKVKIDAPNLMSFAFCDCLPEDFCLDSFPLLELFG
ncbi:F-box/LRR-repeat protein At3g59200-like [Papaver somniferum]|uniref:F-box/LRR-repeat protein At3g59200-like n=1 Tax=Papaver somniferum TaxID=3469 RepID=UPI000E701A81|nr:F-box/LRR-repeat protein At3g59200-like [Papaver somniferum]